MASYLSLAASACADAMNSNALCGADWTALTADFGEIANAGAGIEQVRGSAQGLKLSPGQRVPSSHVGP